jgi:hypothetical protein
MEIKRSSFLWKIVYGSWSEEASKIETTNICRFFWRAVFTLLIYPITVLLILAVVLIIVQLGKLGMYHLKYLIYGAGISMGLVALAIVVWFIASGFRRFRESSAFQLIRGYIRAKKEKVCLTIIFVD